LATDWIGKVVGKLTIISRDHDQPYDKNNDLMWIAKCSCGNQKKISSRALRNADRKGTLISCGCGRGEKRRTDWSGKKVGRLTFIDVVGVKKYPSSQNYPLWRAQCDCGGQRYLSSLDIRTAVAQHINLSCNDCPKQQSLNLIGQKIGLIQVGNPSGRHTFPGGTNVPLFECRCDCGKVTKLTSTTLRNAQKDRFNLSCGCVAEQKFQQYVGEKIGWLRVIERSCSSQLYRCECQCGDLCEKTAKALSRAKATNSRISCGCYYASIDIGQTFGRLTVIDQLGSEKRENGRSRGQWLCQCECGNTKQVESTNLSLGKVKSCGCLFDDGDFRFAPKFCYLTKFCPRCERDLDKTEFGASNDRPGGLKALCSRCSYEVKDYSKVMVSNVLRAKKTKQATPHWVSREQLMVVHSKRIELEDLLGIKLNVDHIVPLVHQNFCGLNVPANLQITSARFNLSKRNQFDVTEMDNLDADSLLEDGVRIHLSVFEE
jgi:hypothetical protein